jgi:hypothetical protein
MATTMTSKGPRRSARKPARPKPSDVCRLELVIRGDRYVARPIPNPDGRAYRLRRLDTDKTYDVAEGEHGPTCDCADAVYRHDGTGTFCKHVRALSALGLITLDVESDPRTWPAWTDRACYAPNR